MIGNLWEWVEDNWHADYHGAPDNGSVWLGGDAARRVTRGGSYAITAGECYTAFRDFARPPAFQTSFSASVLLVFRSKQNIPNGLT